MTHKFASFLVAAATAFTLAGAPFHAQAQDQASALSAVSALPIASVVVAGAAASATVVAVPVVLSTAGTVLVVRAVALSARGTVYVLERASDGARASVTVAGRAACAASVGVGTLVTTSVVGAGVVLSVAGEAMAFLPNALGRALLYNERVTF